MRPSKRVIAVILSACMIFSSAGTQVQAGNEGQPQSPNIELETSNDLQELEDAVEMEKEPALEEEQIPEETKNLKENADAKENENTEEDKEQKTGNSREIKEEIKEKEVFQAGRSMEEAIVKEKTQEEGTLKYIMQENTYIQTPGVQNVAAELGETGKAITGAQLQYRNITTGQEMTVEAVGIVENMVRFTMEYNSENQKGIYQLERVTWQTSEKSYVADLKKLGMKVVYGVNCQVETEADDLLVDQNLLEEVEANIVTMDQNGRTVSENSVAEVLEQAKAAGKNTFSGNSFTRGAKNMVIVLDPGHDSTHAGARGNGCVEEDLVLKIATYCKAELQKYNLVTVYMTRQTKSCPNGGSKVTSATCNAARVEFARKKGADVYVSFHLNSSASSTPRGVGIYYPNGNYKEDIGKEGKGLATEIYKKLKALGLSTWAGGILIRNSENNTLYPDGSLADYLAVIRRSKEAGFPAVLIEHAFLSNAADASSFLSSDAKLKKLGVADAEGIAKYYNLSLKGKVSEITSIQSRNSKKLRIKWGETAGAASYQVYRSTSEEGEYSKVAEVDGNTYDDKVKEGVTYYYKVCVVYAGGEKSAYSQPYAAQTLAKPQITKAVSKATRKLNISWKKVENASQYEILRSEKKEGKYVKIATVGAEKNSYTDGNIKTQKNYYYKVRARGGEKNGYSDYSPVYSGWAVKKTKIVKVSPKTSTSLSIKWKKVNNAYAYRIQRSTSKKGKYRTVATIKAGRPTSYEDKGLQTGKRYYYKIEVRNRVDGKNGCSGYCGAVSGKAV
ncbi:MAG: hypothetical protein HFH41_06000 [Lachnospiraceae bacterium]|nr:hypothetical protein [Lachnospiraceae bacterium]